MRPERRELDAPSPFRRAGLLRLRPITITLCALMGTLPIALGLRADLRQLLGISVGGGLRVSQLVTLFITSFVYLAVGRPDRTDREDVKAFVL
ncbi:MAG: efflux RND transporter permease subunit [Rhizobacter sp.]|nr:efflux RND transporter permease subunit [Rhizobacter sp.]